MLGFYTLKSLFKHLALFLSKIYHTNDGETLAIKDLNLEIKEAIVKDLLTEENIGKDLYLQVLELYKKHNKKVVLCAPTGRAAKRMSETTGEEAKTIHRLLEIGKIEDDKLANVDIDFVRAINAQIVPIITPAIAPRAATSCQLCTFWLSR